MLHRGVILLMLGAAAPLAGQSEGPFGLRMGMTRAQLEAVVGPLKQERVTMFSGAKAPTPHPAFVSYLYVITPTHGLCKVVATGFEIRSAAAGTEVREHFLAMREALMSRYGAPSTRIDELARGSIWNEPQDWMMGLRQKERRLAAAWGSPLLMKPPGSDVSGLSLEARGTSGTTAELDLVYEFTNAEPCLEESRRLQNRIL